MGIVSSIGNNPQEVLASLREAKSGIVRAHSYAELGFRCQVHGAPTLDPEQAIDRRALRFLGGGAAWNHDAMEQAIRRHLGDRLTWPSPKGGFFVWATLPHGQTDMELLDRALEQGVVFVVGSAFFVDGRGHDTIRLSFSAPSPDRIEEGMKRLAAALR